MVIGLDKFKEYFKNYTNNYVIIGGTACDIIIEDAGFKPRATKDIDMILIVEALSSDFVREFWKFVKVANYKRQEKSTEDKKYYRFVNPKNIDFPSQIELFSKEPSLLDLNKDAHLTPIPVGDGLSSLSAILMDEDYYQYTLNNCIIEDEVNIANIEALICLKAKAFLDMTERINRNEAVDDKNIRKHKTDIFRLAILLTEDDKFILPENIKTDLQNVTNILSSNLPDKIIFKQMGLGSINPEIVFNRLINSFILS